MKLKLNIDQTIQQLLEQEDTDGDKRITVDDKGPRRFVLKFSTADISVEGTYYLSNLLQELVLAKDNNQDYIETESVFELPADRISKMIRNYFWNGLTRSLDEKGLEKLLFDSKSKTENPIIYIPFSDDYGLKYYQKIASKFNLKVVQLPEIVSPEYVSSINDEGGMLALA